MTPMRILIGCEVSGVMRRAFAARGHDVWSCDLDAAEDGSNRHIRGDVRDLPALAPTARLTPPKPGTDAHKAWSAIHRASPGPNRARIRSRTFDGMADACAAQWAPNQRGIRNATSL